MVGWEQVSRAEPNAAHKALARMEGAGRLHHIITQNVDGLHQKAGNRGVTDLHGRLDKVTCLDCKAKVDRARVQTELEGLNPHWTTRDARVAPDGDADLDGAGYAEFRVPDCRDCAGILKPDVVFFGESVPRARVDLAMTKLDESDALLVVGSSLMVWSGYRFARAASERGIPIAAINLGRTRADDMLSVKVSERCGGVLSSMVEDL
jgi:NAD-dependent SIR2 family protein deacetylase